MQPPNYDTLMTRLHHFLGHNCSKVLKHILKSYNFFQLFLQLFSCCKEVACDKIAKTQGKCTLGLIEWYKIEANFLPRKVLLVIPKFLTTIAYPFKPQQLIKCKLLLSIYSQLCVVQYGEFSR